MNSIAKLCSALLVFSLIAFTGFAQNGDEDDDWDWLYDDIFGTSTTQPEGCISGDCIDGFGKMTYDDGDIYEGHFKDEYRHGFGKYWYVEGDYYEGEWVWGDREGLGYYEWPSGNEYIGYWENNKQNGKGTKYFRDGGSDAGRWVDGEFSSEW